MGEECDPPADVWPPGPGPPCLPPSAVRGRRQGTRGPPPPPPPPPSGPRADGGRPKKRRPRTPPEEAAAPGMRGHHGRGRRPHALPAAGRQRTGGAQDGAKGAAPAEAGPGKTGARGWGGSPPPPPRRTDPLAADRTAPDARGRPATPTARVYPGGARRRQRMAGRRPTGRAGGRAAPPSPPPPPPRPSLGATGATLRPPGAEGTPPLPQKGPRCGGGGCGWTCTLRAPALPAACSRGGRGRQASLHQRAGATRGPSLGAAHGGAPEQYGGRAPHDPPMTTARSGKAERGFRSAGAPGGAVHGPPLIPPHPGAAPQPRPHAHAGGECADDTRGARMGNRGPPAIGGAGRPRRDPPAPSIPPTGPQAAGAPAPTPRGIGDGPPSPRPREEPERGPPPRPSRRLPQEPRGTSEPAPTHQHAAQIAPSEGGRAQTGVVWGATPPMDRTTPVTPALLPAQGRQRDGTRQSNPPPYRPPPAAQTGGAAHAPPPPARPPAHERHGPAPRHAAPTGRAGQGDRVGPPHPHARAHNAWVADPNSPPSGRAVGGGGAPDRRRPSQLWKAPPPGTPLRHPHNPKPSRGEPGPDRPPPGTPDGARDRGRTRGGARTTWNGPTSAPCRDRARCARHTTKGGGSGRRGSTSAHTRKEHAGTTRRATGPSSRKAQTAWNGVPASEGTGHPDETARHTQRRTRGAGRGKRERHNTRYRPEPSELAASAAHTRTGHCTRQGSSGALRHAPNP